MFAFNLKSMDLKYQFKQQVFGESVNLIALIVFRL